MTIAPISPVAATPAPAPKPVDAPQVSGVRSGIANGIRAAGAGYADLGSQLGVTVDKYSIYPIESVFAAGTVLRAATRPVPYVNKAGSIVATATGFVSAFEGMLFSGMMHAPGDMVRDLANMLADKVDHGKTFDGSLGFGFASANAYAAKQAALASATAK